MAENGELRLERFVAQTDRGALWAATRQQPGDRIVRLIESHFCDLEYRQEGRALSSTRYPRTLQVVGEGWMDGHYYLEYVADSRWEMLETHLHGLHWRARLQTLQLVCDALGQWSSSLGHPLGLDGRNILMLRTAGRWYPWLLPAPALKYRSPCDLFALDVPVLATLAPEVVRGVPFDERARDSYALGQLALAALGCHVAAPSLTDEERVETQARGALVAKSLKQSAVEEFLQPEPALQQLMKSLHHYTQFKPIARPLDAAALREACAQAVAATDPDRLARDLCQRGRWAEALQRLEWGFRNFGAGPESHLFAADICEQLGDAAQALAHLDRAAALLGEAGGFAPAHLEQLKAICERRCELRWARLAAAPPLGDDEPDPEGEALLKDLALLKELHAGARDRTGPYMRAAAIYRRRRDLARAANELFEAVKLEPADFSALFLYGDCLWEMGERASAAQVGQEAYRRIERMVTNQMMGEREAQEWRDQFATLLGA